MTTGRFHTGQWSSVWTGARVSKLNRKAKFDAAFERARRDLRLLDASDHIAPAPVPGYVQAQTDRPVLTLFFKELAHQKRRPA